MYGHSVVRGLRPCCAPIIAGSHITLALHAMLPASRLAPSKWHNRQEIEYNLRQMSAIAAASPPIPFSTIAQESGTANFDVTSLGRVAIVHDWLNQLGGAENVLEEFAKLFPQAPIYTSMYDRDRMPALWREWDVRTSFMQQLPGIFDHHQAYLPLYPAAFATTNLSEYDLVLSNKSGFCHGVVTDDGRHHARHVCYCLTPTRFLWLFDQYRERENIDALPSAALQPLLALLRQWDYAAAQRVDEFIAISATVQERIRDIYHRDSVVIHPPVDTEYFVPAGVPAGEYFLIVSRMIPYKRIDLAVDAFAHLPGKHLVVVGDGRDFAELRARATGNVHFLGRQPRVVVRDLLQRCAAFLFPGLEDFGIAPVEAMACGRPVIAFAGGGALDTVIPGLSGERFTVQNTDALTATLQEFDPTRYDPAAIRTHAEAFSNAAFRTKLTDYLADPKTLSQ